MKSPAKGRPRLTFADLATVHCMVCDRDRPAAGAQKFHALYVCADCVRLVSQRAAARANAPAPPGGPQRTSQPSPPPGGFSFSGNDNDPRR